MVNRGGDRSHSRAKGHWRATAPHTMTPSNALLRSPLREALSVTAAVVAVAALMVHLAGSGPWSEYVGAAVALLFFVPALHLAERADPSLIRFGLRMGGLFGQATREGAEPGPERLNVPRLVVEGLRETGAALLVAACAFPLYAAGFWIWFRMQGVPLGAFSLTAAPFSLDFALHQLIVVAIPEEAFFRGYLQTRLTDAFPDSTRLLGARLSVPAWALQALCFGAVHVLADLDPLRMSVAVPGLLFGWLRARRGGIGAGVVLHALSNMFSTTLAAAWLG